MLKEVKAAEAKQLLSQLFIERAIDEYNKKINVGIV
jgi:hypothetical protein